MKYCKKCLYPDTKPQLEFNNDGVCSACTNYELKEKIDWNKKRDELKQILDRNKSKDSSTYDCIIPVSGGKDSTYQTYVMKEEFGLNPLAVNFHPLDQTEIGRKNLENLKKIRENITKLCLMIKFRLKTLDCGGGSYLGSDLFL